MKRAIMTGSVLLTMALALQSQEKQEGGKWKPYQFKGDERYEYKITMEGQGKDKGKKKETGYILDIRKKSDDDFEVTWSTRSMLKKKELGEKTIFGAWGEMFSPAWIVMNPLYAGFMEQVEIKEGEKKDWFGAMRIEVGGKETIGGQTELVCKIYTKEKDKEEQLVWESTVDKELALPIKSVMYEKGVEKSRMELVSYKKD